MLHSTPCTIALIVLSPLVAADDWPMLGRDNTRNAVSPEKNPPVEWDIQTGKNIKWQARLGGLTFAAPVIADGLVWIGTNNEEPRDPAHTKDAAVLMCFRESDGKFLYQYVSERLPKRGFDWSGHGINCSALVEGDRLWFTTNRHEVVCLDIGPLKRGDGQPKLLWKVDLITELAVSPYVDVMNFLLPMCSIAAYRHLIYVNTGNGVSIEDYKTVPAPAAPSLVCLDKDSGKLVWQDSSPGKNILHGQWSSPLVTEANGQAQAIAPQGDGWVRSFDALTGKLLWKCDTNPKNAKYMPGGRGTRNYLIATPVASGGRVYIGNGQHPEHGDGPGQLLCIDPTKSGDISQEIADGQGGAKPNPNSGVVWCSGGQPGMKPEESMHRTTSNVVVDRGLVIAPNLAGYIHCYDAATGRRFWSHDCEADLTSSLLAVDGKVYLGTWDGDVLVYALTREMKLLAKHDMKVPIYASPIYANGVLYIATRSTLYAIQDANAKK